MLFFIKNGEKNMPAAFSGLVFNKKIAVNRVFTCRFNKHF